MRRLLLVLVVLVALPSYSLEIALGIDPRTEPAPGDWVVIPKKYVESGSIERGKSSELDRFQAGRMDLVINNEDRAFEPEYSGSPYYPNIDLDQHIRLRNTIAAATYNVYRGFISDIDPEWTLPNKVRLSAIDAFRFFESRELRTPYAVRVESLSPSAYWRLNDGPHLPALDSSGNGLHGTYYGNIAWQPSVIADTASQSPLFDANTTYVQSPDNAGISGTEAFSLVTWFTSSLLASEQRVVLYQDQAGDNSGNAFNVNLYDFSGGELRFEYLRASGFPRLVTVKSMNVLDGARHMFAVTRASGSAVFNLYVDGTLALSYTEADGAVDFNAFGTYRRLLMGRSRLDPPAVWWKGLIGETSVHRGTVLTATNIANLWADGSTPWQGDTSGARVTRVLDEIDWPAGLRDIDTGDSDLQVVTDVNGESALDHLQRVEASEFGGLYVTADGKVRFRERSGLLSDPQAAIGRDVGQLPYVEIKPDRNESQLRNEVRFTRVGGVEQVASVSNRFFYRTFSRTNLMNTSDEEVRELAATVLDRYQVPLTEYTVTLNPRADDALWDVVFERELEDPVMVSRIPPLESTSPQFIWDTSEWDDDTRWGSAISRGMRILAIKHDFGKGFTWKTTWKMSPV